MPRDEHQLSPYRGTTGTTRKLSVHTTCRCGTPLVAELFRSIDAAADPILARRFRSTDPGAALNTAVCPADNQLLPIEIPVIYHDPTIAMFALVLPESYRHRELRERADLLLELAADTSAPLPSYVIEFAVVFGAAGLDRLLEERGQRRAASQPRTRPPTQPPGRRRLIEVVEMEAEPATDPFDLVDAAAALASVARADADRPTDIQPETPEIDADQMEAQEIDATEIEAELPPDLPPVNEPMPVIETAPPTEPVPVVAAATAAQELAADVDSALDRAMRPADTGPGPRIDIEIVEAEEADPDEPEVIELALRAIGAPTEHPRLPVGTEPPPVHGGNGGNGSNGSNGHGARPISPEGSTHVGGVPDVTIERWIAAREESIIRVDDSGAVRVAASLQARQLDQLLGDSVQLRIQLHRMPTYPVITLSIGTPNAFAGEGDAEPFCVHIDVGNDGQRAVVEALGREFSFVLELYDTGYSLIRRRTVSAAFADNARVALAAASDHLSGLAPYDRSFARALVALSAPSYDRYARMHPGRREFRDDVLRVLDPPSQVYRALAMTKKFSQPENEDYLVFLRGYPLALWQERRRAVIARAVELGLSLGPVLANLAVSEGIARSRKDLAKTLHRHFAHLVAAPAQHDLDPELVRDNWTALGEELTALGLDIEEAVKPRTQPIDSETTSEASGTIGRVSQLVPHETLASAGSRNGNGSSHHGSDTLIQMLEDKDRRLEAAQQLADRGDVRGIAPVFEALKRMTRGEAGRVLGAAVGFGKPAVPYLLATLDSRKGYLRQGAALALAVLKDEEGIEAICDLLVSEPTEIWREISRAIGEVGAAAVMPLASRLANQPSDTRERVAWALAHAAARGAQTPIETLAKGRDAIAAGVARHALELMDLARSDDVAVRGRKAPRDQTVNRAFSRRFFEALERGSGPPAEMSAAELAADLSGPAMLLDEADLIEAGDLDAEALDESDLIPT